RELESRRISTLAALAGEPQPITWKPTRGARDGYVRVGRQAHIQLVGRNERRNLHELLLPVVSGGGFAALPVPSPGDLFLDLEADPFVDEGGIEYLFGWVTADAAGEGVLGLDLGPATYHCCWALDRSAERLGFESVVDTIMARWVADPGMHVYHFGAYEPGALKRLMGRYATREAEVDRLLRGGRFVDLHSVVRRALRASVGECSMKTRGGRDGCERGEALDQAGGALRAIQRAVELALSVSPDDEHGRIVEAYNREDCLSARALRDWLEGLRAERVKDGEVIARPQDGSGVPNEEIGERERRSRELAARLLADVLDAAGERTDEQQALGLL